MVTKNQQKTETIAFRLDKELLKKIETVCKTENKTVSSVDLDACKIYAQIYPFLHALKSKQLYPNLTINEEVIKEEIFTELKKLI